MHAALAWWTDLLTTLLALCMHTACSQVSYEIKAQMLEIYNESLRDLLVRKDSSSKLDILSTQASGCNVPNATKVGGKAGSKGVSCVCVCHVLVHYARRGQTQPPRSFRGPV